MLGNVISISFIQTKISILIAKKHYINFWYNYPLFPILKHKILNFGSAFINFSNGKSLSVGQEVEDLFYHVCHGFPKIGLIMALSKMH